MDKLLPAVIDIAYQAGQLILPYTQGNIDKQTRYKEDDSPITIADQAAHDFIALKLAELTPDIPLISEEGEIPAAAEREQWSRHWLVDPLDGTRAFIENNGEFTVNIALIEAHQPVLGVIVAPAFGLTYYASRAGAFKRQDGQLPEPINTTTLNWQAPRLLVSARYPSPKLTLFAQEFPNYQQIPMNSSLKICKIAEGAGDLYPKFGHIKEWDTAAGQCILEQAGGAVVDFDGKALQYNARNDLNNPKFVAVGDKAQLPKILELISKFV